MTSLSSHWFALFRYFLLDQGPRSPWSGPRRAPHACGAADCPTSKPSTPPASKPPRCREATSRGKPPPTKWEAPDFPAVGGSEETAAPPKRIFHPETLTSYEAVTLEPQSTQVKSPHTQAAVNGPTPTSCCCA